MSLLLPLGLLGLLALLGLFLIYIIKPNYQQKLVSSTFVWKLSLKYQKKRLPINKLRNLLILLCQIVIFVLLALILTQPAVPEERTMSSKEKVIVIDASASMLATTRYDDEHYTRFEQAVDGVIDLAEKTFKDGGKLTIILADSDAKCLEIEDPDGYVGDTIDGLTEEVAKKQFYRVDSKWENDVMQKLASLKSDCDSNNNPIACTYGSADIKGAMEIAENITTENPLAEVYLFTGKQYLNKNGVTVVNVSRGSEEVNVAVLDMRAVLEEGYYTFYADVVSYGENSEVNVDFFIDVDVFGGDAEYMEPIRESFHRYLRAGEVTTVIFDTNSPNRSDGSKRPVTDYVYTFSSASVSISFEGDAIIEDNSITLYGGVKPTLKVQYASSKPSIFFSSALMSFENAVRGRWDVDIDEVRGDNGVAKLSGYDFYIFEHTMPSEIPQDGVVFLVNPTALPAEMGIVLDRSVSGVEKNLIAQEVHPLLSYMNVSNLLVTSYNAINTYPEGYTTVMQCDGRPVFISKNTADEKIAVMTFSTGYSDIAVKFEFPMLVYNMIEYFIPSTFTQYIFDVNDTITFKARGSVLELKGAGVNEEIKAFPAEYVLTKVGSYTTSQTLFGVKNAITENFFVKIPAEESNIGLVVDVMPGSVVKPVPAMSFDDLLVYFAAALVALLFVEWWLQSRSRI
ncbi:MAG: VWA domain-containing protein [Clostridiales bacterium]|nr:VWA domain-containing protein [Clostridiales bacterium]